MAKLTLTFDNGPHAVWTPHVLDVLKARAIKTTFFVVGRRLLLWPELRGVLERARDEGHWIANHSYNHVYSLGDIDRDDAYDVEVKSTFDVLGDLAHPDRLYRPFCNAGIVNDRVFKKIDVQRLQEDGATIVFFNSLPHDWDDKEGWVGRALDDIETRDWSTIVLHDIAGYPDNVDVGAMARLDEFITIALERGHEFVQEFSPDTILVERGKPLQDIGFLMH
ncbi:polysaccharide deacetylase family protein [Baekduia soli]|uniref:Polysaccharide deacetylase family protein n=1 Tax=Baekduia soli TaxID=496014 RepID=A0A5B8UBK6_9ACTN|nr:polysaccharide deacetylase family protein [Baekduia soli]QEC50420.1 polysaccharide deacetylase family protein [Baekduia soli]